VLRRPQNLKETAFLHFVRIAAVRQLLDLNFLGARVGVGDFIQDGLDLLTRLALAKTFRPNKYLISVLSKRRCADGL
jgi:hypothetical protein